MKGYRYLEHTADIKVEAWGKTLEEAFEAAAIAFTDVFIDVNKIDKSIMREIMVEGFDLMSLLFNWIEELIHIFEVEEMVFCEFNVNIYKNPAGNYQLMAIAFGETYDREKHGYKVHVKAMTYHEMEIIREKKRYIIRYVLDI